MPEQHHDFGDGQLGDAARIRKRRIEHRNAHVARGPQIDLVGADGKAADRDDRALPVERLRGKLRARADAEHGNTPQGVPKLLALQRLGAKFDARIAGAFERGDGGLGNALKEQDFDLLFRA